MSSNKKQYESKVKSLDEINGQTAKSVATNNDSANAAAKSARKSGNHKDGKSHPSGASQTKAGARSNPNPPAKMAAAKPAVVKQIVTEEKAPERAYTSTIAFVEKLLPTTGSLMAEAISAKISSLANARDELVGLIEAAKEDGVTLNAEITKAEKAIETISGMVFIGALRTNERLDKLSNDDLERIALAEYAELWAKASADVLAQMKIIAAAKSRYAENKEVVLEAAKRIRFLDAEIAEWRSML